MCLSRQYASTHVQYDLLGSPRDLEIRSNFELDFSRSTCTWFDASWREKDDSVRIIRETRERSRSQMSRFTHPLRQALFFNVSLCRKCFVVWSNLYPDVHFGNDCCFRLCLYPRPAGPSPTLVLCWVGGGGGGHSGPDLGISVTNRRGGKIQPAMESTGRDISDWVKKLNPGVTCDVTGQVKHNMFEISILLSSAKCRK